MLSMAALLAFYTIANRHLVSDLVLAPVLLVYAITIT